MKTSGLPTAHLPNQTWPKLKPPTCAKLKAQQRKRVVPWCAEHLVNELQETLGATCVKRVESSGQLPNGFLPPSKANYCGEFCLK